jgi:hypothetical protein
VTASFFLPTLAEGLGLKDYAGPIDTNMLNTARPGIKQALDNAINVQVLMPQSLKGDLQAIVQRGTNPLTDASRTTALCMPRSTI